MEPRGSYSAVLLAIGVGACSGQPSSTADSPSGAATSAPASAGAASVTAGSSSGASGSAAVPSAAPGADAGEPPLSVSPVATWGGQALNMVPYATSGSRLKAIGYTDADAVFFGKWHDAELDADCAFERSEAGDWLCTPLAKQGLIFLDAACQQPATEVPAYTDAAGMVFGLNDRMGSQSNSGGGDSEVYATHSPVYRITERVFGSDGQTTFAEDSISIYTRTPSSCTGPRTANRHVVVNPPSIFRVEPVADSELVKATARRVPLRDGVSVRRFVTDDGAQLSAQLELDGEEAELERDGRVVPLPVAEPVTYADPDCKEWAFRLPSAPAAGVTPIGVDTSDIDTSKVFELTPTTTLYSQETRVDVVTMSGQTMQVVTVTGCKATDVSGGPAAYYRRAREISAELPKLDTLQLGTVNLSPIWFFGWLSGSDARIQVQIHSPDGSWVRPNIQTNSGMVCAVYDERFADQCLMKDGLSMLPVIEVEL